MAGRRVLFRTETTGSTTAATTGDNKNGGGSMGDDYGPGRGSGVELLSSDQRNPSPHQDQDEQADQQQQQAASSSPAVPASTDAGATAASAPYEEHAWSWSDPPESKRETTIMVPTLTQSSAIGWYGPTALVLIKSRVTTW